MSRRTEWFLLVIIFLLSLGLRLIGLRWGLPYPYGHDGFFIISHAVRFFEGDFNPHWFIYPSFHMYFLFFIYKLIYGIGYLGGHFSSTHQFCSLLEVDPSLFIITARAVAALLGSGSIIFCYVLARRLFGWKAAFLTLFLAVLPLEVVNAHYATSDVPLTFWLLLTFIFCARIMERPYLKYYILAGIFTGVSGGTKYPGLGLTFTIILAHLMRLYRLEKKWRPALLSKEHYKLFIALGMVGLAFFISTPYVFLDYKHSIPNLVGAFQVMTGSCYDIYQRWNESLMFVYVKNAFQNFGYLFVLLGLSGTLMMIKKLAREEILLLSWIIPLAIIIHISKVKPPRYFLLLSPFLLIFFANAIIRLKERFGEKFAWQRYLALFIALLMPLQPLYNSIKNDIILTRPDTREEAHDWIIKNIPEGTVIAKEFLWTPFLPKGRYKVIYDGWSLGDNKMAWYKERDAEYFLISKKVKDLMSHPDRPTPLYRQFYEDLEKEARLIHEVSQEHKGPFMNFHNPTVLIYKSRN